MVPEPQLLNIVLREKLLARHIARLLMWQAMIETVQLDSQPGQGNPNSSCPEGAVGGT